MLQFDDFVSYELRKLLPARKDNDFIWNAGAIILPKQQKKQPNWLIVKLYPKNTISAIRDNYIAKPSPRRMHLPSE